MKNLKGKTALITGGALRLGKDIALSLAKEGVNIALHYRNSKNAAVELCKVLEKENVKARPFFMDFEYEKKGDKLIDNVINEFGSMDILINNASVFPETQIHEMELEHLTENINVNAWIPFTLSRAFYNKSKKGSIINFLDTRVFSYDFKHVPYYLSKHMLYVLTRKTALAFSPNFSVNAVAPGPILPPPGGYSDDYLETLLKSIPMEKVGNVEDIVESVLFLVKSEYITGQVVFVDGGRHLKGGMDI